MVLVSAGTAAPYSRGDHVHPTDTTRAPTVSPTFTGSPVAPTPVATDSSTLLSTTAFVKNQNYAPLANPTFTGVPAAPTAAVNTSTTQLATTAFVTTSVNIPGMLFGMTLANNGTNPNTSLDIGAGTSASDDAASRMTLASTVTKTMGAWAAGGTSASPVGGLDTGTAAANTWYHVFIIYNPTSLTTDVILSASATAPTFPTGYTKKRRVGSVKTTATATNFTQFIQTGDRFDWATPVAEYSGTPGVTSAVSYTLVDAPSGVITQVNLLAHIFDGTNAFSAAYISSLAQADVPATGANATTVQTAGTSGTVGNSTVTVNTNTTQQIRVRTSQTTGQLVLVINGWTDTRGK